MLVLRRNEGQWVEVTHEESGDSFRFRVYDIGLDGAKRVHLAFDDDLRRFRFDRPDRHAVPPAPHLAPISAGV